MSTRPVCRNFHLLTGGAVSVVAMMLAAAPAAAQVADSHVYGANIAVSEQTSGSAPVMAVAGDAVTRIDAGPLLESSADLSDNGVVATARGNYAATALASADAPAPVDPTMLAAGSDGLKAHAGTIVATGQRQIASPVQADIRPGRITLESHDMVGSTLEIARNEREAAAFGNEASGSVDLAGSASTAGAGIVTLQQTDGQSGVVARSVAGAELASGPASGSSLSLHGNSVRALGFGNSVASAMTVTVPVVEGLSSSSTASNVPDPVNGDPTVAAAYAILSNQKLVGDVAALASGYGAPPFGLVVAGALDTSRARNDANTLVAAGYGNRSANTLALDTVAVAPATLAESAPTGGAIANVTNVQRIDRAAISASAFGGTASTANGAVTSSEISTSGNVQRAEAVGNLAEENRLDLTVSFAPASTAPFGTVQTDDERGATADASFSVQNVQDYGRGTIAAMAEGQVSLRASDQVHGSALLADENVQMLTATGNDAVNVLNVKAISLRASSGVNNVQSGDGSVRAAAGSVSDPAGVTLSVPGAVRESRLSVSGNETRGTSTGNAASNHLLAEGTLVEGSGSLESRAGALPSGRGATADLALSSFQRLGQPLPAEGNLRAEVYSELLGRFAVGNEGDIASSSLALEGNSQRAGALGNTAANQVSVGVTSLGGGDSPPPGSALFAAQYGHADVIARSTLELAAPVRGADVSLAISANGNQALAAINDAENRLAVKAVNAGTSTGNGVHASIDLAAHISGDHVLGNLQVASGSAVATAQTAIGSDGNGGALSDSRILAEDNATAADASANRAVNRADFSLGNASTLTGIASLQTSTARVDATAAAGGTFAFPSGESAAMDRASITVGANSIDALARGNVADNQVTHAGMGAAPGLDEVGVNIDLTGISVRAPTAVLNTQVNSGSVSAATARAAGLPFNVAASPISATTATISGNSASASAYGNTAQNVITGTGSGLPSGAAIANVQYNQGSVTANASGMPVPAALGSISGSSLAIAGNAIAATATGNQATNIVASSR